MFISGIGTDVGKTVVSAIVAKALHAPYWKPVQAGDLHNTDSNKVVQMLNDPAIPVLPEAYRLTQPMSPHAAAAIDNTLIRPEKLLETYQAYRNQYSEIVVEGAGGLMVPLNPDYMIIDLIADLKEQVILVSSNYLGSINHTLLSIAALQSRNITVAGIIFNGNTNAASEELILKYSGLPCLLKVPQAENITPEFIAQAAAAFSKPD